MARPYMSIFPFSLLNFFFSLSLFISCLSPLIASLHELPQEITSTNISKMKQLKSGRKLFQGGIRSSFLLKVSLVGLKTHSYRQHLFFHPGYVRFKMCHTSKYTQTLGWHVLDMNRLTGWQLESQWCWDFTEVGDVGLSLMPLKIAASVSACQTILPKSRLPWQDLGAPRWEERRSNQEQTAKRLRREAGAFPPSPLASSTLIRGERHVHGHPGNGECHSVTQWQARLCVRGRKKYIIWWDMYQILFSSSCLCLSGISCMIWFNFFPSHDPIGHPPWELSQIMCFFKKESIESKCTKTHLLFYFSRWDCS